VEHPELGQKFLYPGAFAKFSLTPIDTFTRSPRIGEHTQQVLARLDTVTSARGAQPQSRSSSTGAAPFSGVKIVDFTWAAAGPITTRHFGDYGATVIKIESNKHPDSLRVGPPFVDARPGINRSGFFAQFNPNKLSMTLDMTTEAGRSIARRLILEWSDVVVDSFTPRVMRNWGLSHNELSKQRPDLVMLSTCMQGQTGPYRDYAGFGDQGAALSGFFMLNGWPDREPATPNGAYTDMATPHFGAVALMAALDYRARTGRGQHIDLSQVECGVHFLAPEILDYTVRGRVPERMANRSLRAAPHGVFPVRGDDAWIAIACETDAQWHALVHAMYTPAWATLAHLQTLQGRLQNQDDLESQISDWTSNQNGKDLQQRLLEAGVPSGVAHPTLDLFDDPQLVHRKHFVPLDHPEMGVWKYDELGFILSDSPSQLRSAAPLLGQHTRQVLQEFLGIEDAEYQALVDSGAIN
jgi:benzylsuccinate CoA-transferase BbsF subunit